MQMKCCICGQPIQDPFGHNPWPVRDYSSAGESENRCCSDCNNTLVVPFRIFSLYTPDNEMHKRTDTLKKLNYDELVALRDIIQEQHS